MCGRYVRRATKKAIADWFGVDPEHLPEFGPSFNIAPQTFQPVVRLAPETGEREIVLMRWGLVPFWARDARDGVKRINAQRALSPPHPSAKRSQEAFAIGMRGGRQYG